MNIEENRREALPAHIGEHGGRAKSGVAAATIFNHHPDFLIRHNLLHLISLSRPEDKKTKITHAAMPGMAFNSVKPTIDNYEESMHMLYEEAFITIMVVWFFLRKWRATLISAVALPLSLIPAFGVMSLAGFSLNVISLLALSLVVGILVDDAIVEVENITRHLRMGKKPYKAALEAANEIGLAVIATSLTLVAVFLPTAFMGGARSILKESLSVGTPVFLYSRWGYIRLLFFAAFT